MTINEILGCGRVGRSPDWNNGTKFYVYLYAMNSAGNSTAATTTAHCQRHAPELPSDIGR